MLYGLMSLPLSDSYLPSADFEIPTSAASRSKVSFCAVRKSFKRSPIVSLTCMQEVVDLLHDEYGWSDSVSNLSAKLQRESIRYKEVVELANVLDCDIVWVKRGNRR